MFRTFNRIRRLFLYNRVGLVLTPQEIADLFNKGNPENPVAECDILEALGYGTICADRFEFEILIKYRGPCFTKEPVATFTFGGRKVKLSTLKKIGKCEKRFGQIKLKMADEK